MAISDLRGLGSARHSFPINNSSTETVSIRFGNWQKPAEILHAYLRSPVAGRIARIGGVVDVAVTGADATVQVKVGGVNVTAGLLTWPLAGAAAGQAKAVTPSAADNAVAEGDVISAVTGGGGTQTGSAFLTLEVILS